MFFQIVEFILAIPSLLKEIQTWVSEWKDEQMQEKEAAREKTADQTAQDIKHAQDVGDEKAQDDALSRTVDDYNS